MFPWLFMDDWHKYFHHSNAKNDISEQPFIRYDIFEAKVNFPPSGTPIGIIIY